MYEYDDEFLTQADPDIVFEMRDELLKARERIALLEKQIAALLQTIEAAIESDGQLYSEGCKP